LRFVAAMLLGLAAALAAAKEPNFISQDQLIPGPDPGVQLHLRNKYLSSGTSHSDAAVLFVHGATFPASSTFDVALPDGDSWMSLVAARGLNVYSLDVRGYGGSTRPAAMSQPPEANPPFARSADAVRDIGMAADFILKRNHAQSLTLIGWSWGTTTTAAYAAQNPDKVKKLILVSPVWLPMQPPQYKGAYRFSTHDSARAFAIAGIPKDRVDDISPMANFEAWWLATLATDPEGSKQSPPVVRSPNGVMQDFAELWAQGKPTYDPAAIRARTLLIVGEWDVVSPPPMAEALYKKLVNAQERRMVLMSEATHFMLIEKHRLRVVHEVQNFLQEQVE
jgi:pimeloyl-ACP methyl ester carboxylesterase